MVNVKWLKNIRIVGAIVSLAAIPLIVFAWKKPVKRGFVPEAGDESDIFARELSDD